MVIAYVLQLLEVLRDNRLLDPGQLEELDRTAGWGTPNGGVLAQDLVRRGWLTPFQVEELEQGRAADLVAGPYRLLDCLGQGGVSQVFKAWDTRRNALVVLKVIRPEFLTDPETTARFEREIQSVSRLDHPNIVKDIDIDQVGQTHYFAMEYVEGKDLGRLVQERGPLPLAEACDYIRQAALGLQHAHEHGLVHRDVKPANLLLTGGVIKVLDLGLAMLPSSPGGPASHQWTQEGTLLGTPDYVSPEQARSARTVDARADVYSLGCTLYYLLTGQPPHPGKSLMQKLLDHQQRPPIPVELLRADVSPALAAVVRKMLAKKPAHRQQTAAEVADALAPFCAVG
jgi:serine/threonine-protein kinase